MGNYTHAQRWLSFMSPLGKDKLLVDGFEGHEAISANTELRLTLLSAVATPVPPEQLIGQRVTLGVATSASGDPRYFNGMVRSLALVSSDTEFLVYEAEVVSSLWLLTLNTQTRVFQNKTVIEIVKAVLEPYSIVPSDETQATYQPLDYCTQYRETDYEFVARILQQHGVFFYFKHTDSDHTMVLADNSMNLSPCPLQSSFDYMPEFDRNAGFYNMYVRTLGVRSELVPGKLSYWDYRFTTMKSQVSSTSSKVATDNSHERYDYADAPSAWAKIDASDSKVPDVDTQLLNVWRDRSDASAVIASGGSNASAMAPGFTFQLSKYPDASRNIKYLLLRVEHKARQNPPFRGESAPDPDPYEAQFVAQPASVAYRPQRTISKPRVQGVVTGKVVVPSGEDSYLDKYGRVCVQFWWDRTRPPGQTDNTLLRVAQPWAGSGWGTYFWPRVNDEVLIDFIDGDPDAPIVVGSLYNGVNQPKYDPATAYTRSGILTRSSKQGDTGKANELRFEDLKGSEQVYVHAERDFDEQVEHDRHVQIGNEQHVTVKANQYETLQGETHRHVSKDHVEAIGGDRHLNVTGSETIQIGGKKGEKVTGDSSLAISGNSHINVSQACNEKIGMNYSLQVGMNHYSKAGMVYVVDSGEQVHLKGGMNVVIEGGLGVCLSGPGGFISIDPTGVTIQGLLVKINSGGASLEGSPATPEDPQPPGSPKDPTDATWPEDKAG